MLDTPRDDHPRPIDPSGRSSDPAMVWAAAIGRSPLAMLVVGGSDRTIRAANYAFGALLGVPGERLVRQPLDDMLPDPTASELGAILDEVQRTGRPGHAIEMPVRSADDRMHYWRFDAWPLLDVRERPDGVCVQASDITERVEARERERQLTEDVREANDRLLQAGMREQELAEEARRRRDEFAALLHSLTEGVAVIDRGAGVALMNEVGRDILGIEHGEDRVPIGAYRAIELRRLDRSVLPFDEWPFNRVLAGARFSHEEFTVIRPDGSSVRVVFHGSGVAGATGDEDLGIVVFEDVTELRRLEELRAQYTSLISHDLRAPLGALLGYAELLESELRQRDIERGAQFARRIRSATDRMRRMLDDLIRTTQFEAGALRLRREATDVHELIQNAVDQVSTPADRKRVRIQVPAPLPRVVVDAERLSHAVANLIGNALKYAPSETRVLVRLRRGDDEARISVTDYGPGVPDEELPRLFQRFYRGEGAEASRGGVGLGLYIARLIVEAHGGRIWVESKVGEGSTFSIALPVVSGTGFD